MPGPALGTGLQLGVPQSPCPGELMYQQKQTVHKYKKMCGRPQVVATMVQEDKASKGAGMLGAEGGLCLEQRGQA